MSDDDRSIFDEEEDFGTEGAEGKGAGENFKVVIRVRPPVDRELNGYRPFSQCALVDKSNRMITISENITALNSISGGADSNLYATYRFTFDRVYDIDTTQEEIYKNSAKPAVISAVQGYNAAIIAYGQTGTGKTHTMEGSEFRGAGRGVIPRAVEDVFDAIENDADSGRSKYLVRASYLQIYNEVISDLLKPDNMNLIIREDRKRGVYVEKLSEWVVRTPQALYELMERGANQRATGATKLNEMSSRSHAVLIIIVEKSTQTPENEEDAAQKIRELSQWKLPKGDEKERLQSFKVGKLNLVDLAGSERVHMTGATGKRLEESKKINQSLSALGNVIAALTDPKGRSHIPYRDSKLTRILEDSLGGNCKTTMLACITPSLDAFAETLSTLKFANRAKNIKNDAKINEDLDQRALLRKYERELKRLRAELEKRNKELVDKRHLLELEEQKRRAEQDKLAALETLEARSKQIAAEKEEKRRLEEKITSMQSQLLIGGHKIQDIPVFRQMLEIEQRRIRTEYEKRLKELEEERKVVEVDKSQVDKYKSLLLKQRDIMIALTARLNERDEQILILQEELEAYDTHQRKLEDDLDNRVSLTIAFRKQLAQTLTVSEPKLPSNVAQEMRKLLEDSEDLTAANPALVRGAGPSAAAAQAALAAAGATGAAGAGLAQGAAPALAASAAGLVEGRERSVKGVAGANGSIRGTLEVTEMAEGREPPGSARGAAAQSEADRAAQAREAELLSRENQEMRDVLFKSEKERHALKTIMENKMKLIVGEMSAALAEVRADQDSKITKQVKVLDKLLTATLSAMGRSEAQNKKYQQLLGAPGSASSTAAAAAPQAN